MKKNDLQRMLAWLSQVLNCPICDAPYATGHTRIIESKPGMGGENGSAVIHSDCQNCKSSVVFSVSMIGSELFSVGMISDLSALDTVKFRNTKPISADEIIGFHSFLSSFKGDFQKIFNTSHGHE